jgi:hypothetical protein
MLGPEATVRKLAAFFATAEGERRLALAAIGNMPVKPSTSGYLAWLLTDFPDIVGERLSLDHAKAIVTTELEGRLFNRAIVRSARLAKHGWDFEDLSVRLDQPSASVSPPATDVPLRVSGNVTHLPGIQQSTWMMRTGLPAYDPAHRYSKEELQAHARAFQEGKRTRPAPWGEVGHFVGIESSDCYQKSRRLNYFGPTRNSVRLLPDQSVGPLRGHFGPLRVHFAQVCPLRVHFA